jgi:NAD(P)H dehydrogenase (quinone)
MIVVLGASGRTGRIVAAQSRAEGRCPVRMVTRHPSRARAGAGVVGGVEVALATRFDDGELARVMKGARALYAILPDDLTALHFHAERRAMAEAMARAIQRERVPRVVLLSSRAAALGERGQNGLGADLAYLERLVLETSATVTILRASYFQDNVTALLPLAEREGIYPDFLPPGSPALVTIAASDVGTFAARSLLVPPRGHREIIDLVGPVYTATEIGNALGQIVGRPVSALHVPPASQREQFQQWMSPEAARAMVETFQCLGSDPLAANGDRVERGTTRIEQVLREALAGAPSASAARSTEVQP